MKNIHWNYVRAFTVGLFFLLAFSKMLQSYTNLTERNEKFLFIYEDMELLDSLTEQSQLYEINCEKLTPGETAGVIAVREADNMSYLNIADYFRNHDGKIEVELIQWVLRLCIIVFVTGTGILLLRGEKRKLSAALIALIWFFYLKLIPGSLHFPKWALPMKWSDFEGWLELKNSLGRELFSMIEYQSIPDVGEYKAAVYGVLVFLPIVIFLMYLYYRCCTKLRHEYILHLMLSAAAVWFYISCANPEMKAMLYLFPCFALSRNFRAGFTELKSEN